jgi:erythromycin esterase-like protein
MSDPRRTSRMRVLGISALFSLALLPSGRAWAQPVDLLNPDSVAEAAGKKKPPRPQGFPILPGVYRLYGSAPDLPKDDLEPLRQIIGQARIVSLGESIHTSGGYYEMKHRVFRFLVERMGFRAFAFESPWPNADRVGQYVATCGEAPEEALSGLFGVWQSAETRDLIQWMCDWNRSHRKKKDKLFFFGFDVQQSAQDATALIAFLERLGIGSDDPRVTDIQACDGVSAPTVYPAAVSEASNQRCLQGLAAAEQLIDQEAGQHAAGISPQDLDYARLRVVGVRSWQGQVYYRGLGDLVKSSEVRDSGMAYAFGVLRRLRYGDIKTAVWAHNFHIAKDAGNSSWGTKTMGSFLREMFGSSYVALALISNITEIDWLSQGCGPIQVIRFGRVAESRLHDLGYEALLLDLDFPGGNPPFLTPGQNYRFSENMLVPASQFDGAFFLERSRKMDPLRWPSCQ